ncbi:hypothetical protein [Acinetobacter sp. 197]|uniref:hypothetical protein n=1 Tax=Acinetobacter sp. 197 TaxID=3114696 RepID=UPI003A855296
MQEQQTQAMALQQPKDQKIYLDLQHSTDWVVVISVIASALISFIGFLITIYIVKKSTESQIKSNKDLIQSQEESKKMELETSYHKKWFDDVVECIVEMESSVSEWAPTFRGVNLALLKEKERNLNFEINHNEYYQNEVEKFYNDAQRIFRNIKKLIILLKIRNILSQSLECDLLNVQTLMNNQLKCITKFEDGSEENQIIYLKNLAIADELQKLLNSELNKFKKAA